MKTVRSRVCPAKTGHPTACRCLHLHSVAPCPADSPNSSGHRTVAFSRPVSRGVAHRIGRGKYRTLTAGRGVCDPHDHPSRRMPMRPLALADVRERRIGAAASGSACPPTPSICAASPPTCCNVARSRHRLSAYSWTLPSPQVDLSERRCGARAHPSCARPAWLVALPPTIWMRPVCSSQRGSSSRVSGLSLGKLILSSHPLKTRGEAAGFRTAMITNARRKAAPRSESFLDSVGLPRMTGPACYAVSVTQRHRAVPPGGDPASPWWAGRGVGSIRGTRRRRPRPMPRAARVC
jgi:hypothetical protein